MRRYLRSCAFVLVTLYDAPLLRADNTCATAQLVTPVPGAWLVLPNRNLGPGDLQDYYRVNVPPGYEVEFMVTLAPADGDIDLRLWNPDCTVLLAESVEPGASAQSVSWTNLTGTAQAVRCEYYAAAPPAGLIVYDFWVRSEVVDCSNEDGWEENDDCAHPRVIPFEYYINESNRIVRQGDEDYYRITVPANTAPRVTISHEFAEGDIDAQLFDANCSTLIATSSTSASEHLELDNFSQTPRTFVVRVYLADSSACNVYSFRLLSGPGHNYCTSDPNSSGSAALMDGWGSASVTANDLQLHADHVPLNTLGIFFYGPQATSFPFGNGTRCVGGTVVRSPVLSYFKGHLIWEVDYDDLVGTAHPVLPGITYNYQCWFRDPAAGGANFDLTDGYRITFTL